jgi:hypothetical protein
MLAVIVVLCVVVSFIASVFEAQACGCASGRRSSSYGWLTASPRRSLPIAPELRWTPCGTWRTATPSDPARSSALPGRLA